MTGLWPVWLATLTAMIILAVPAARWLHRGRLALEAVLAPPRHGPAHYCPDCGRCLCGCRDCALFAPCCCAGCWSLTPTPHLPCTCTPVRARQELRAS